MTENSIQWSDVATIVAFLALGLSIVNTYFSWRRGRLDASLEKRRLRRLEATLIHSYYKIHQDTGDRNYVFQLTVRNPSDSDNAVSEADLAITYITEDGIEMTSRVRSIELNTKNNYHGDLNFLPIPVSVSAHDTISGWFQFTVPVEMIKKVRIECYEIILRDTHHDTLTLSPILVQEYRDET